MKKHTLERNAEVPLPRRCIKITYLEVNCYASIKRVSRY